MKFGELISIGHNIADSFACGMGFLIGVYAIDVFGEAARSPEGHITVDFLNGKTSGGEPSASLAQAVELYRDALPELCARHKVEVSEFSELTVKFIPYPMSFVVTVANQVGKRSIDAYAGLPGKRAKILDTLGRVRRK
jgi:hypothetical protein